MLDFEDAATAFREFVAVVKALRTPGTGCPWDLEQDHRSLRPYLLEEAHEVIDAIDAGGDAELRDELGDLLLQVVLHAQLADDRGAFDVADVLRGISAKMVRRHPHVFGYEKAESADDVRRHWERIKAEERGGAKAKRVPLALPALARAQRVAKAEDASLDDVRAQLGALDGDRADVERRLGDALFGLCRVARALGVNAEDCLREATRREEMKDPLAG